MKILNVRFRNINSLKGDWEIAFDRTPFADAGILAITGPTGAGKTSILDAVTLALYGETPRLKRRVEQIMTKHTGDCFSAVTFSVSGREYCSTWMIRKARKKSYGKFQPARMELAKLGGKSIEDKLSLVPERVAELTGLDFKRFSRSIMLAQGDFAAFLNAKDNERAELLEKITGTEIYSKISKKAFEKAKTENEKLDRLKEHIRSISLTDPSQVRELEQNIRDDEARSRETEKSLEIMRQQEDWLKGLERLEKECMQARASLGAAQNQKDNIREDICRLAAAKKAMLYKPDLDILDSDRNQLAELMETLGKLHKQILALENQHKVLDEKRKQSARELDRARKNRSETEGLIEKVLLLDRDIANEKKRFLEFTGKTESVRDEQKKALAREAENKAAILKTRADQGKIADWLELHDTDRHLPGDIPIILDRLEQLADIRKKRSDLESQRAKVSEKNRETSEALKKAEPMLRKIQEETEKLARQQQELEKTIADLTGEFSLEHMEKDYKKQEKHLGILRDLFRIAKDNAGYVSEKQKIKNRIHEDEKSLTEARKVYAGLEKDHNQEENIRAALEKAVEQERLIAKYEDDRKELKPGQPCPLCGSPEHPFVTETPDFETDSGKALRDQKRRLKTVNDNMNKLSNEITRFSTRADQNRKRLSDTENRITLLQKERDQLCAQLCAEAEYPWDPEKEDLLENKISTGESENRRLEEKITQIRKHKNQKHKISSSWHSEKQRLAQNQTWKMQLENDLNNGHKEMARLDRELQDILEKENAHAGDLQTRISAYKEKLPGTGKEKSLGTNLENRWKTYQEHVGKQQDLEKNLRELQEKSNFFSAEIRALEKQARDSEQSLRLSRESLTGLENKRKELFMDKDPVRERQNLMNECEKRENEHVRILDQYNETRRLLSARQELAQDRNMEKQKIFKAAEELEAELLRKVTASDFESIEHIRRALLPDDQQNAIEKEQEKVNRKIIQAGTRLETALENLDREKAKEMTGKSLEQVSRDIGEHRELKENLARRLGAAHETLKQQNALKQKHNKKMQEIENQDRECIRWNRLKSLIGSRDGDMFRKFAQGLTLDRLIFLSNRHLEKLSGRYRLNRQENQNLGLEIIDTYQADIRRSVSTLSGGESFLVSLAMALGLSDLASRKTNVDSFFLDEGFGSLDDEALDIALSTLENLQAVGKMIGVISHVEALKERITTRIQVEKMAGGISRVNIVE